ncbi:MAG: 16S rRNA (uracil(1498)-N(3))-methyltransferase [Oscillospiraceae bacterium]|nr:16S rRNA (uracil(1498)-N(3))-methyltransferase [Oscillospiraceae bacterium]
MHNFFVDESQRQDSRYIITGADYNHIINVLRMNIGDSFLVSTKGQSDLCEIEAFDGESVTASIIEENYQNTELSLKIYLFQGLPKGDKMEFIIQKSVELGVYAIIPTEMNRCVVKLDEKKKKSKVLRWQAISESAAKQSKRNYIPKVLDVLSYKQALKKAEELDLLIVPYENAEGMVATKRVLEDLKNCKSVGILIGSEGGFDDSEIELVKEMGGKVISLGKRILRTETAAITTVAMCMLNTEINSKE